METRIITLYYGSITNDLVRTNAPKEIIREAIKYAGDVEESFDMSIEQKFFTILKYIEAKGCIAEYVTATKEKYNYM